MSTNARPESEMAKTMFYALVGSWEETGCQLIVDYSTDQECDYRAVVLSIIDGVKTTENDRIDVDRGNYTVHILFSELCYACLTLKAQCPSSAILLETRSQEFLQQLRSVYRDVPILANLSVISARKLTGQAKIDLSKPLSTLIADYNHLDTDFKGRIAQLKNELGDIRCVLMAGIEKLIDRGQRLDEIMQKAEKLEVSTKDFHVSASVIKSRRRRKNILLMMIGAALVTLTMLVLMIVVCMMVGVL